MGKRAALLVLTFLFPGEERRRGAHAVGGERQIRLDQRLSRLAGLVGFIGARCV